MSGPKSKISKSKSGMRRSHNALKRQPIRSCPNCNSLTKPHNVCPSCGYYRNREIMAPTI